MDGSQCKAEAVDARAGGIEPRGERVEQRHGIEDEPSLDRQPRGYRREGSIRQLMVQIILHIPMLRSSTKH